MKITDYKISNKKTLNIQVYEILKEMILNDAFDNNRKLNEVQIANQLGVSATPVREAFRKLETDGLVETIPWKGVFIRKFTVNEIKEVYECREALEILAIKLCIKNIVDSDIQKFIEELGSFDENITSRVELSNRIHEYIMERSNNKKLKLLINQLKDVLSYDRILSAHDTERVIEIYDEHKEILLALLEKNENRAIIAMKKHLNNGFEYYKKIYKNIK